MKHNIKVTIALVLFFLIAQITGLLIISQYVQPKIIVNQTTNSKNIEVNYNDVKVFNEKIEWPDMDKNKSWITIMAIILVSTIIVLILIHLKRIRIWKSWFGLSVFFATYIAIQPFIYKALLYFQNIFSLNLVSYDKYFIGFVTLILVILKLYKHNIFAHNITEIIMYGGIATLFVPILNLFSAIMLLLAISVYDIIAVWKSKHMVKMAKFQMQTNIFSGLMLAYDKKNNKIYTHLDINENQKNEKLKNEELIIQKTSLDAKTEKVKKIREPKKEIKQAVLGGGDIAFPLIFAGTIFKITASIPAALIIIFFSTLALSLLFLFSKPNKFYPAMPFISAGCLIGYSVVYFFQTLHAL